MEQQLAELMLGYQEVFDLAGDLYDCLKKWGISEPVLERYTMLVNS